MAQVQKIYIYTQFVTYKQLQNGKIMTPDSVFVMPFKTFERLNLIHKSVVLLREVGEGPTAFGEQHPCQTIICFVFFDVKLVLELVRSAATLCILDKRTK